MNTLWGREPVMIMALIQAGLALAVSFGFNLSGEQTGAVMAFSAAFVGMITRSQVSPGGRDY